MREFTVWTIVSINIILLLLTILIGIGNLAILGYLITHDIRNLFHDYIDRDDV